MTSLGPGDATPGAASLPARVWARRPAVSVRTRMLSWVIVTAAIGIAVAGALWFVVQLNRVDARVAVALDQEIEELGLFASAGVDPATGQPFATVDRLFVVAAEREVPDERQTFVAVVDGRVVAAAGRAGGVGGEEQLDLSSSAELLARLDALPADVGVTRGEVDVEGRTVVYATARVQVEGQPEVGTYVVGYDLDAEHTEVTDGLRTFAFVAAAALLLVGLVGWLVVGRLLAPIRLLRRTAQRIGDTDLTDRIAVRGHDDVSDLGRTFNAMLDRLQSAFEIQRNFLDDAGHELRTPLTIVRGHLELLDPDDPTDTRETRQLVLDEVDRMQRLVDELLLLAKARRPDFVAMAPVRLDELVTEVLEKARPLGDRRWELDEVGPGVVVGDQQRLTQALLQLVANAVKFGQPGDVVALGGHVDDDRVRLWVRDTGPGVEPADQERIFQRFGRAATGRGVEGSGLGLAIVSAIAVAHGGRVVLRSSPGAGATFTLELPVEPGRPLRQLSEVDPHDDRGAVEEAPPGGDVDTPRAPVTSLAR